MVYTFIKDQKQLVFHVDGDTSDKQSVINDFTKHCTGKKKRRGVMCATIKAGGVGLNMQAANRVVFTDIGYSPNVEEEQAICRANRIGQRKPVWVYSISVAHSVDDPMGNISANNKELFGFCNNGRSQLR